MNIQEEIRSLSRISERFRKSKKQKSKWPVEFQLRILKLIASGYSPTALSKKLEIPVQTYYHWRRIWKNAPTKHLSFLEVPISDKLEDSLPQQKESGLGISGKAWIALPGGARIENLSEELLARALNCQLAITI